MKRFSDTDIWTKKPWFIELTPIEKCAFLFITAQCDNVGVWTRNTKIANTIIGENVNWLILIEKTNGNIEVLKNGKWWLIDFCDFQYGKLSENCKPHQSYIALLKKHGLYERVCIGFVNPTRKGKGKGSRKGIRKGKGKEEDIELYNAIKDSFESKHGQFDNYPKEGEAIYGLINKCRIRAPDNPEDFAKQVLETFWQLKQGRDNYWRGQPFLPSALNASGIWPRVLEEMRETEPDTFQEKIAEEVEF